MSEKHVHAPGNHDASRIREDRDGDRPFLLHPEDDDLFVRTGRQIIDACRLGISVEVWLEEMREMFAEVGRWVAKRPALVAACYAAPRGDRTALFVVPASDRFDFDLADELVELDANLLRRFNVGAVEIYQVPRGDLDRFVDPAHARALHGGSAESPSSVEA